MNFHKCVTLFAVLSIVFPTLILANNHQDEDPSIEFFASNNTQKIDLQTAFHRLQGEEQLALQNETIHVMQKEHMEQSRFENLLGMYKMSSTQHLTADNSEKVITSSYQKLSPEKAFTLAHLLANTLKQESVAVFIPSKQSMVGDIVLNLKSHAYTINETLKIMHDILPIQYNQAFSLYLNSSCSNFYNTTVSKIEWLGSNIKPEEIKKAFPQEAMTSYYGKAYVVYKNGQKEAL